MKKLLICSAIIAVSLGIFGQAPERMSYQAVIRNASGALVTNQAVGIQISILQGSATGTAVFVETHTPTTNANGLQLLKSVAVLLSQVHLEELTGQQVRTSSGRRLIQRVVQSILLPAQASC